MAGRGGDTSGVMTGGLTALILTIKGRFRALGHNSKDRPKQAGAQICNNFSHLQTKF